MPRTNRTRIETCDFTWTPASGCLGTGCAVKDVCWAKRQVKRLGRFCPECPSFIPHMHMDRLKEPLEVKHPYKIFPVSTGDLFGLEASQTKMILDVMEQASWHTFQPLTKQPQNAQPFSPFRRNIWFGVSVNTQSDVWRLNELQKIEAPIRFAYFEPLLTAINYDLSFLDWIVIGGESRGGRFYPPPKEWVTDLITEAREHGIRVYIKRNAGYDKIIREFPKMVGEIAR